MKSIIVRDNSLFQKDVAAFSKDVTDISLINGNLIEDVILDATTVKISHPLQRSYKGYIIVKQNADETIYVDTTSTASLTTHISLKASGTVTVSLWVF